MTELKNGTISNVSKQDITISLTKFENVLTCLNTLNKNREFRKLFPKDPIQNLKTCK